MRVFVSYTSTDREFAEALASALEELRPGLQCWHMYGERSGTGGFGGDIADALDSCTHFVLVYSPDTAAASSGGCENEVVIASNAGVPRVVVTLHQAQLSGEYRYHLAKLTPVVWKKPAAVTAREVLARFDDLPRRPAASPQVAVCRVLIVDHVDREQAISRGLRALGVDRDNVEIVDERAFDGRRPGVIRIVVKEPGTRCVGSLVVTLNPHADDTLVSFAASQLRIPRASIRVHVLERLAPDRREDQPYHVLVCPPQFPVGPARSEL